MRVFLVLCAAMLLAGCGSSGFELGTWRSADGDEMPEATIYSKHGYEHCGTEDVWIVAVGRDRASGARIAGEIFIRDPDGDMVALLGPNRPPLEPFQGDASRPDNATDTGFRNGDAELWLAADGSAAFLVFDDRTERWPTTVFDLECD
ncbi:MAG: hypothetical protein WED87_05685 [Dehalococcoidia bacterium]